MDIFKPLIALVAMVNPIGVIPFFIAFTQEFDAAQRQQTIRVAAFTCFCVIALSALFGLKLIEFFGISIASFQVGGGALLLINSLQMLNAKTPEGGSVDSGASTHIAVVPLAIPLLTGPATISTMVIYAQKSQSSVRRVCASPPTGRPGRARRSRRTGRCAASPAAGTKSSRNSAALMAPAKAAACRC
jgi:multiple antibiotic resistance protein